MSHVNILCSYVKCSVVRVHTDTHTWTDGTDSITSTAGVGGKNPEEKVTDRIITIHYLAFNLGFMATLLTSRDILFPHDKWSWKSNSFDIV